MSSRHYPPDPTGFASILLCSVLWLAPVLHAQDPVTDAWPEHPRLIATPSAWAELREQAATDPELHAFIGGVMDRAREVVPAPALERRMEGRRLLGVSREALRRVLLCSFAYRWSGDHVYLDRARTELLAVAAFDDWNPSHFLDVAEMATAVAIGYDWLHAELTPNDRALLVDALVNKALIHGRDGHPSFRAQNNWSQVCIGGLGLAALAIGDEEPDLARSVLSAGRRDVDSGLRHYRPDGIYPEGPSYWEYGTSYTVLLVAALRSVTGDDWGILQRDGLEASAAWVVHMTGPTGAFYNFADGGARAGLMPALFFFARELNQSALLRFQRDAVRGYIAGGRERLAPLAAFWWLDARVPAGAELPLYWSGQGRQPIAAWRSSWEDPDAFYFAIKAGGSAASHGHMDGGSFILESVGVRWAEELGLQSYHSLEARGVRLWSMTQDSPRWRIFRLGPFSHNTLTIDGQLHDATGMATLAHADERGAVLDLTPIFLPNQVANVTRQVEVSTHSVTIEDTIQGAAPDTTIRWAMATRARIELDGQVAILRQDDRRFPVRFNGSRPEVIDISQPASDLDVPNPGMRLLVTRVEPDPSGAATIRVTLGPAEYGSSQK
jgi:oligo-alginate lyase